MQNIPGNVNFASFYCLSPGFLTNYIVVYTSVWYQNVPLINGNEHRKTFRNFQKDLWLLQQDLSNPAILAESQYSPLTKTFTVGFKHLGFQKFQLLTLSTFQGQEDDVSITSLAPLQLLQTVLGRQAIFTIFPQLQTPSAFTNRIIKTKSLIQTILYHPSTHYFSVKNPRFRKKCTKWTP